jgi:hypothetical protein
VVTVCKDDDGNVANLKGRTVCVYRLKVEYREKRRRKGLRYIRETSAPVTVSLYEVCNTSQILYVA